MRIIGFTGRKGSGKNEAANAITDGITFAFAGKLKGIARDVYDLSWNQTDGDQKEVVDTRWGLTPREIMQRLGTEVARGIHPDTWIRYLLDRHIPRRCDQFEAQVRGVRDLHMGELLALITDVRFPNEAAAIRERGGIVIRIVRPGLAANAYSDHPSETAIDTLEVDHQLTNDGTIADLHAKVRAIVGGA